MAKTIMTLNICLDRSLKDLGLTEEDKHLLVGETALFFKQLAEILSYKRNRPQDPPPVFIMPSENILQ